MLEVKNLTKKYPKFNLENVNLSLPKGQIMGFIGKMVPVKVQQLNRF